MDFGVEGESKRKGMGCQMHARVTCEEVASCVCVFSFKERVYTCCTSAPSTRFRDIVKLAILITKTCPERKCQGARVEK